MLLLPSCVPSSLSRRAVGFVASVAVAFLAAGGAQAAFDAESYRQLNDDLVRGHVLPRYERLADASGRLAAAADAACDRPSPASLSDFRAAALAAWDAWQSIQHVRFGPVERQRRAARIQFWPDVRNHTGRRLGGLLRAQDDASLAPGAFADSSVAVQGFSALERLLFEADAQKRLTDGTPEAAFRCALARTIAVNLSGIAQHVVREWSDGDAAYSRVMANAGRDGSPYAKPEEATLDLFKSLFGGVELVGDVKLWRPTGEVIEDARPKRAEAWRSARSMDHVRHNLEAAQAMYIGGDADGSRGFSWFVREVAQDAALDDLLRRAFAQTLATARGIRLPLRDAVGDPDERAKLDQLSKEVLALRDILAQRLAPALGVPVGFNSLDGD